MSGGDQHFGGPGFLRRDDGKEADGTRADDGDPVTEIDVTDPRAAHADSQRFSQTGRSCVQICWQRMHQGFRYADVFRKATRQRDAKQAHVRADVGFADETMVAIAAAEDGLHGDLGAGRDRNTVTDRINDACHFMTRLHTLRIAKRGMVDVQIGTADTAYSDADPDPAGLRLRQLPFLDADDTRTTVDGGLHLSPLDLCYPGILSAPGVTHNAGMWIAAGYTA